MINLITFDTDTYTLDAARITSTVVTVILLLLMRRVFKQRKYIKGSYYSPVLIFTCFWLTMLLGISLVPLVTNMDVISTGFWFALLAAAYIWSLAGMGWIVSNYTKQYDELTKVIESIPSDLMTDIDEKVD
jgi:hypothetical protein